MLRVIVTVKCAADQRLVFVALQGVVWISNKIEVSSIAFDQPRFVSNKILALVLNT